MKEQVNVAQTQPCWTGSHALVADKLVKFEAGIGASIYISVPLFDQNLNLPSSHFSFTHSAMSAYQLCIMCTNIMLNNFLKHYIGLETTTKVLHKVTVSTLQVFQSLPTLVSLPVLSVPAETGFVTAETEFLHAETGPVPL